MKLVQALAFLTTFVILSASTALAADYEQFGLAGPKPLEMQVPLLFGLAVMLVVAGVSYMRSKR